MLNLPVINLINFYINIVIYFNIFISEFPNPNKNNNFYITLL